MKHIIKQLMAASLLSFGFSLPANAHCHVGNRFFPATITIDDPCVADELSFPTIAGFKNGDNPSAQELDVAGEYSKTITLHFGISFEEAWIHLDPPGPEDASGFDNLGTSFKYQFVSDAARELAMSVSLDADWGGTGSSAVDAEPFTTLTPTLFFGKGLGFLQAPILRPLAITGQVGYAIPTKSSTLGFDETTGLMGTAPNPRSIVWGGTLQYSMPYLKSNVRDFGLPQFVNHLVPLVELDLSSEVSNFDGEERTTGTVNPGVIYVADKFQFAAEAIIPINRASGDDIGVVGQLHFYLEDIFPHSLGRPLFGGGNAMEHHHE
jgi:hypothetical protein